MGKKIIVNESQLRLMLNEIASAEIDERTQDVDLNPTEGQKQAGNYKMAHISVKGMEIAIENPKGSKRYYTDEKTGEKKFNVMNNHYGYFNITKGKDGDAVDVFIGPDIDNFENVYCVDQNNKEGEFDETKVMLGFTSKEQAKQAYLSNYSPGWKGFRAITGVSIKHFKKWLYRGRKQRQPFADYVYIQKKKITESINENEEKQKRFRAVVDIIKERIKYLEGYGGKPKFNGRGFVKGDYYFSTLVNEYITYGGLSFVEKAVARALREVKEEGIEFNYYKGI